MLLGLASGAGAQMDFKCQDAEGRTVYAEHECVVDGLLEFGEVQESPLENQDARAEIQPCRADARQFCYGAQASGAAVECLIDHENDISEACYQALKAKLDSERDQR